MSTALDRSDLEVFPLSNARTELNARVRSYWNTQVHDAEISESPAGTLQFFRDIDAYRLEKLDYLPRVIDFSDRGDVLEIGCGVGLDLLRFASGGARAIGVDASETAIGLARRHSQFAASPADFLVADGSDLPFASGTFDLVYCHGVLPYAAEPDALIREAHRVLRVGGEAVFMAYNRHSWLMLLSRLAAVRLAHSDAPVFRTMTRAELRQAVAGFDEFVIVTERFPVATRLQSGWKAGLYNSLFVPAFQVVPVSWIRPWGWHLIAFCRKLS